MVRPDSADDAGLNLVGLARATYRELAELAAQPGADNDTAVEALNLLIRLADRAGSRSSGPSTGGPRR